jgi:hypothetical protein
MQNGRTQETQNLKDQNAKWKLKNMWIVDSKPRNQLFVCVCVCEKVCTLSLTRLHHIT